MDGYGRRGFTKELQTEKFEVMGGLVWERVTALKVVLVLELLIGYMVLVSELLIGQF